MVHLAAIPNDSEISAPLVKGMKKITIQKAEPDTFTSSVYGSRFAGEELPRNEMPEDEMPKEIAYRMIKDELSLDGNPMLK
jgi:glutamate decarboxylase